MTGLAPGDATFRPDAGDVAPGSRGAGRVWRKFRQHRLALFGLAALAVLVVASAAAPLLTTYDPFATDLGSRLLPPSASHWMGTDELGRDIFTRILYGGRISLGVGVVVAVVAAGFGGLVGALSAYAGGLVDEAAMRFVDMVRALPALPFLIVFTVLMRSWGLAGGFWSIVAVLAAFTWTDVARIVRGVVLSLKEQDFVTAAKCVGIPGWRIVGRHLLPNALAPMLVATTLGAGIAILAESALSFLGLGIQPPTPSWGNMLFNAQNYLWTNPQIAVFPGAFIFLTLLSLNLLGDGLRDALDPRMAGR